MAVSDDYTPDLAALLEWSWFDARGIAISPTAETIQDSEIPVQKVAYAPYWYWAVSAPHYRCLGESQDRARKRWDADQAHPVRWGKRRAVIQTACGPEKSYDLPIYLRHVERVDWWCVGDSDEVLRLLMRVSGLGKRRNIGYGQISGWRVQSVDQDYHLCGPEGQLMRPMPVAGGQIYQDAPIMSWAYRPPGWLPNLRVPCYMPNNNVAWEARHYG
jgi:CRISPR type IV-associated protein Csf3